MSEDDEPGLSDDDVDELQEILERNREVGANEHTMDTGEEDNDRDDKREN